MKIMVRLTEIVGKVALLSIPGEGGMEQRESIEDDGNLTADVSLRAPALKEPRVGL